MTPHGHLVSITRKLKSAKDFAGLMAYVSGDGFLASLNGIAPGKRQLVWAAFEAAWRRLDTRPPLVEGGTYYAKKRRMQWRINGAINMEAVARLKAAEAATGSDEGIARMLGITRQAAKKARWEFLGRRTAEAAARREPMQPAAESRLAA